MSRLVVARRHRDGEHGGVRVMCIRVTILVRRALHVVGFRVRDFVACLKSGSLRDPANHDQECRQTEEAGDDEAILD